MRLSRLLFCFVLLFCSNAFARTKILAQVNDDIISELDFQQRLAFIKLSGQADITKKNIRDQVLKQLIDEKLKQQEARTAGIEVSKEEITQAVKITLQQNGLKYENVIKMLKENNLPVSVVEEQIKSDLMYIRAIKKTAGTRADVSEHEIDTKMSEIKDQVEQKQFLISEIVLPVETEEKDAEVYGTAMQLIMQMRDGAVFEDLAEEFSKSPTAKGGGFVGWIGERALSVEEREELSVMQPGQLSTPIKTAEGYKLFLLRAARDPSAGMGDQETVHLVQLFLPEKFTENQRKAVLRDLTMTKGSCTQFLSVSEQLKTTPRIDLGVVPVSELPEQIRSVVNRTALLEPSTPLRIDGGELILMTCAREKMSPLPKKEAVKGQIESMRLETLAQRRLRELRRNAVTEIRQ